jgi:membrane-associated protein
MEQLTEALLSSSGWAALALVFTLPALEAPAFIGLVLPGELALLLGGVLAHQGRIPLAGALAVGVGGALAGDSAGYWIGRCWGPGLLTSGLGRRVGPARLQRVESLLLRGGGWALVVGRCTAGARVVLPGLAGMLGLRYRTFALWTGAAATLWAVAHVLLGYLAGAGWRHVHHLTGRVGLLLAGAVVVALAVAWLIHRHRPSAQGTRTRRLPCPPLVGPWRQVEVAQCLQVVIRRRRPAVAGHHRGPSGTRRRPRLPLSGPRTESWIRRELTSVLGVLLAADTQLSAGGRRRQRPNFVPSSCPAPST